MSYIASTRVTAKKSMENGGEELVVCSG